jgi:cyclomaltodextrinase / maltogenic alpha-amylase / neopullulanase
MAAASMARRCPQINSNVGAPEHDDVVIAGLADDAERAERLRSRRAGVAHRRALTPRAPRAGEPIVFELTAGPDCLDGDAWLEVDGDRLPLELVGAEWDTLVWGYVRRFRTVLPGRPAGVLRYRLGVGDVLADGGAHQALVVGEVGAPAWAADAVVYQLWVDRFWSGDAAAWPRAGADPVDYYGGTLGGLLERLDHLVELGANTVWLNPIYPSSAYHGYEVTDFQAIEPRLGSLADFDRLVAELHRRGVRIVLDFVPSHVSHRHRAFAAAQADASDPFAAWFRFDAWPDDYRTFFGVRSMPQLNQDEPAVRAHLVEAGRFWLERGIDGFRLDHAHGSSIELWAEFRAATREANPDCWLFGEVVETPQTQLEYEGLLDGCLDFELAKALRGTFGYRDRGGAALARFLDAHEAAFPCGFSRPSFLDNHDMNRLLWIAGGDPRRLKLAALCQFTLAGPPIVYYGTEVGLSQQHSIKDNGVQGGDRHARLPMLWEEDHDQDLFAFFRDLVALRRERADLRAGPRETLRADLTSLAYARGSLVVEFDLAASTGSVRDGPELLINV